MTLTLSFQYKGKEINPETTSLKVYHETDKTLIQRDIPFEDKAIGQFLLNEKGFFNLDFYSLPNVALYSHYLNDFILDAMKEGWEINLEKLKIKPLSRSKVSLSSGIDWFELKSDFGFDGYSVELPMILKSIKNKNYVSKKS